MIVEPLCEGEHCLIVGSAPDVSIPDKKYGCILGANGGAAIAQDKGLQVDVLVTTAHLFRGGKILDSEQWTIQTMKDLIVDHIWVDTKNGPVSAVADACAELGIAYLQIAGVSPSDRAEVVSKAVGRSLWVSSGIWAVCLAKISGAASITIAGISLTNGHYGMEKDNDVRFHTAQDSQCLRILKTMEGIW